MKTILALLLSVCVCMAQLKPVYAPQTFFTRPFDDSLSITGWMETTFDVQARHDLLKKIRAAEGVSEAVVVGRYRMRIGYGRLFPIDSVQATIRRVVEKHFIEANSIFDLRSKQSMDDLINEMQQSEKYDTFDFTSPVKPGIKNIHGINSRIIYNSTGRNPFIIVTLDELADFQQKYWSLDRRVKELQQQSHSFK